MPLIDRITPTDLQTTRIRIAQLVEGTSLADVMTTFVCAVEEMDGATADGLCLNVKLVRVIRPPVHIPTKQEAQDGSPLLHRISKRPRA
ncbi:uncharacterized protein PGTG_21097 [Puccinia graminis f. sp. tritici CRL 75-36-700-3]|uniref:Uncharacterized protein n=1 Tax=Puccinia graminis f. sp. tritici (strain CRL 75-36-700-3 / race SCCL) TaxID=418459 RepID=H6QVI4_PUCGT|nr:uncharacterized protein PGTG_22751 [Puccinia graminis f. sp. tritici CRL 75-36-700-3]XP_003890262.1 uncharacterized protein PGTG_21097 [Puccinia graminis f. sp. tritici CRL 75-36-700-3]EHS62549.1 hypothetical protein PGTG_21097 [Puccinia graminis f. sp. tritici CRL 75-36-700-3]EHS63037.1 hypothetical protein PGTG_22751 [Puccinia graminis f. sp. tritici CRL 75-36-700-3]